MKQVLPIKSNSKYWVDVLKEIHFFYLFCPRPQVLKVANILYRYFSPFPSPKKDDTPQRTCLRTLYRWRNVKKIKIKKEKIKSPVPGRLQTHHLTLLRSVLWSLTTTVIKSNSLKSASQYKKHFIKTFTSIYYERQNYFTTIAQMD